jgi:hypothetical protein
MAISHAAGARYDVAEAVRDWLQQGAGAVEIKWSVQTPGAQTAFVGTSSLGSGNPFGTGALGAASFTWTGSSTWTNVGTAARNIQSFAIFDNSATPAWGLKGAVETTGSDINVTGGTNIGINEKIKITSFTYNSPT